MTAGCLSGEASFGISETAPDNLGSIPCPVSAGPVHSPGGNAAALTFTAAQDLFVVIRLETNGEPRRSEVRTEFGPRRRCLRRGRTNRGSSRGVKSSCCLGNQSLVMYKHDSEHGAGIKTASESWSSGVTEIDKKMNRGVKQRFLK